MSGYTKYVSNNFIFESRKEFNIFIKKIAEVLPLRYNFDEVLKLLIEYYPYEWQLLQEKCSYYHKKDEKLISLKKKQRHYIPESENIIKELNYTKKILAKSFKEKYNQDFNIDTYNRNVKKLKEEREPKIKKIKSKIDKAKLKAQSIEPVYLDKLMGLYDRKNTSQKDKIYIFKELEKYYCHKTISFFKKKVDTEYNRQLREMAFYHLQSLSHFSTLRKQKYMRLPSKNKKRKKFLKEIYANEKFDIQSIPQELEYRIVNSKEQIMKEYDFFISHSSSDYKEVQKVIEILNLDNKNVYCDWISDTDYLKRSLVGDATKSVIEKRLSQSKNVLFITSDTSVKSNWVKYELNFFNSLARNIYFIDKDDINKGITEYKLIADLWFLDENYKSINLY